MTVLIIAVIAVLLFVIWNVFLPFYRDPYTKPLVADESKCFSEKCRSIVYEHGSDECVLMIHGYPTCPDMYSYTAARLRDAGYDVHAPLIPTFGADPGAFAKTDFTQWYGYIDQYYIALRQRYARVYVVGVSMGGAMTLKLAEEHSATPLAMDAIVSIASPVAYNCLHLGIITNPLGYFARTFNLFVKTIGLGIVDGRDDGDDGNEEWRGYKGIVMLHGISLTKAFNTIRHDLGRIAVPMFVMHDRGDRTVPFSNLAIICRICHDWIRVRREVEMDGHWRHSHHSLLMYHSVQQGYTDEMIEFLKGGWR